MLKLNSQKLSHLSESVLKTLSQNRITTIIDFLQEDVSKLSVLTKLSLPEILAIRNELFTKYSAPLISGTALFTKVLNRRNVLSTGIDRLDAISNGGIPVGYITELCGLAGSGKTQLSFQLAINCVKFEDHSVLYVDTKGDFSAVRIQKILDAQQCSHKEMAVIMYKIRVVHIWTMEELVELFKSLKNKSLAIEKLALIIVDSLPCLMFQHMGDENKMGLSLLNTLVNYSRFIGNEFDVGIVYINIQTRWIDTEISDMDDDGGLHNAFKDPTYAEKRNRCLGKYWEHIPALVLLSEKLEDNAKDRNDCSVQIKVPVINHNNFHNLQCVLNVSPIGIT